MDDSLKTPAEMITELVDRPKFKCKVLRQKPVTQHELCDYCNHDGEDIFELAFSIGPKKKADHIVIKLHQKKVCNSCMFFFKAIEGVDVDSDVA